MDLRVAYRKSARIDHRTIGDEAFIVSPGQAEVHALNEVGAYLFDRLDGTTPTALLIDLVVAEFEVDRAVATADVVAFLTLLEAKGLAEK